MRGFWLVLALLLSAAGMLRAEPRIALVIGNSAYQAVSSLPNPSNDARLIAETLTGLGFDVTLIEDGDMAAMQAAISAFGGRLRAAGEDATGLFYYAGHGVQSFERNYLLPVDAAPVDAADLGLVAIEAENVLRQMASARNRTNIVILDACRNNPFKDVLEFNETGLAEMRAPTGTFLAYATDPGEVAMDGIGDHSPFTAALAAEMVKPGEPIEQVFKNVRVSVLEETRGLQTPWDTSSLTADFSFAAAALMAPEALAEQQLWDSVKAARDPVQVMLYMRAYPDSPHTAEAEELLRVLMAQEVAAPGTEPALVTPAGTPSAEEIAAFNAAQAEGTASAYQDFIAAYPESVFAEAAGIELAALNPPGAGLDPDQPPAEEVQASAEVPVPAITVTTPVTFRGALVDGGEGIAGRSIAELITATPLYPPIEGLPDEVWKNKQCSTCHQWTQEALCTQAQTYVGANAARSMELEHPLGGPFKVILRAWAEGGCQ